ncbi:MAG: EAL domain-containing protein [Epsilonproteobacteria bacterium]|nr:EAL domain-containing protein [Campylobacterota bacterium]
MINLLNELISYVCECKGWISKNSDGECVKVSKNYYFCYECIKNYKKFVELKLFLERFLSFTEELESDYQKYMKLKENLIKVINANEKFFTSGKLDEFFDFLEDECEYALIENLEVKLNKGIDKHTINVTIMKLQKAKKVDIHINNGELYAIKVGYFIVIIKSKKTINELIKHVTYARLLWLNALYEAKHAYDIDTLTGAYSRKKFLEDIKNYDGSLIYFNIKNFKMLNELYNERIGDLILKEFFTFLKLRFSGDIYRVFADRFVIKADRPVEICQTKVVVYDNLTDNYFKITLEIEGLFFEESFENFLEIANIALKKKSKCFDCFKDVKPVLEEENYYFNIVLQALENDWVVPFIQKVVHLNGELAYYEVLIRIKYNGEYILPSKFLYVAKEKGVYRALSLELLKKAIKLSYDMKVSLNVDVFDLLYIDSVEEIVSLVKEGKSENIQFEIVEEEDMYKYFKEVKSFVDKIKALGCKVALDDFGKGYSNFALIKDLEIDTLKIDISLVKNIQSDPKSYKILKNIVSLSKELGIKSTVEGVENEEIYSKLKEIKPDYLQGYLFDRPKPAFNV